MSKWTTQHHQDWWLADGSFSCPLGRLTKREVEQESKAQLVSKLRKQTVTGARVPRRAQAVVQFRAFDIDEDGVVSFDDFATAMIRHNPALAHPSQT